MVVIPAGEFLMGSPPHEYGTFGADGPQRQVTIAARFALGRYPVTFEEYDHFCNATRRRPPEDEGWGRGRRPVINVSWRDAVAYCEWLSKKTDQPCRLPSEAEWEYACRAGTSTRYWIGNEIRRDDANFGGHMRGPTLIAAYSSNPWGLYDMHGNLWEWTEDIDHSSYAGAPADGSAWTDGEGRVSLSKRIVRGGSRKRWNAESSVGYAWQELAKQLDQSHRIPRCPDAGFEPGTSFPLESPWAPRKGGDGAADWR
jgi:formylglycine-generating enzyme required for sulfatase activity